MYPTIDNSIIEKLRNSESVHDVVGLDVYMLAAPQHVTTPYIVFKQVAGGFEYTSPRPELDIMYRIECIADTRELAEQGSRAIYDALHDQRLEIAGWDNYDTSGGGWYALFDLDCYRVGGMYRIRADQKAGV